ncbi:MAG TPA: hypothetical protein VI953_01810 [Candidatus Paceibacterota bacterium]
MKGRVWKLLIEIIINHELDYMTKTSMGKVARIASIVLGVAMFATVALPASAATIDDLLAQIAALQAQLLAMQGGSTSTSCNFTMNLSMGMQNSQVMDLQKYLNAKGATVSLTGAGAPGQETSYFGARTKAAVMVWQNMHAAQVLAPAGLSGGTGFWGMFSRTYANTTCGGVVTPPPGQNPPPVPPATGGISVSAAAQPANSLAPESAARVPFTNFTVTAGAQDATLNSVVVERQGLGADAAFDSVVLIDETGAQVGNSKTLNSDHRATIGENVVIKAGTSRTFTVAGNMVADNSGRAGQVASLALVAVNASGSVSGSFPIVGATHTINATLDIGTVTMGRGSYDPGSALTKEVGVVGYNFSSVRVTAGSNEDMYLRSIRWNQTGSAAPSDLANLTTVVDGVSYSTVISSDSKYYSTVFPAPGLLIVKGASKDITIKGDIVGGSGRTIAFDLAKRIDINLVGKDHGYGTTPPQTTGNSNNCGATTGTSCFTTTEDPWYDGAVVTVSAGTMNVSSWSAGVPSANIAEGVSDVPIAGFTVDVKGEGISVGSMIFGVGVTGTVASGGIDSVKLIDETGKTLAGPTDVTQITTGYGTVTLSNSITFKTGVTKVKLVAKVDTSAANNDTVVASTTPGSGWTSVKGETTGNTITPSPSSAISGSTQTVKAGTLTITVSTLPPAQNVVAGSKQFTFANYIFDGSASGEDVRMNTVPLYFDTTGTRTDLTNCSLYDGATALNTGSNVKNPATTDTASSTSLTFDGTGLIVTKGTSKTLSMKCDLKTGVTTKYWWGVDAGATFTATGLTSGTTITPTATDANGQIMTAVAGGGYSVVNSADSSVLYRAVQAGATDVILAKYIFTASTSEDVTIKQIVLALGNTASNSPADLVGQQVTVWKGTTQVGIGQFGVGGTADVATSTLSAPFNVPKGESVTITVKGSLTAQDSINGTPGAFIVVNYDGGVGNNGSSSSATGNYGTGVDSGSTIGGSYAAVTNTNGVRVFRGVPTISVLSSGCATCLQTGVDLYKIRVTAPAARGIGLRAVSFNVSSIGIGVTGWQLVGPNGAVNATAVASTTNNRLIINFDNSSTDSLVDAGDSKDYAVRATGFSSALTSANTETVSINLVSDTTTPSYLATGTLMGSVYSIQNSASSSDKFVWTPFSSTTPAVLTAAMQLNADWTNSYGVPGFNVSQDLPAQSFSN